MPASILGAMAVAGYIASQSVANGVALRPLTDANGNAMQINSTDGIIANAIVDTSNRVVWANYAGTENDQMRNVDDEIIAFANPATIPAFADAASFATAVRQRAAIAYPGYTFWLTGFSLGATFAEWVGLQQNAPGIVFASAGLPYYTPTGNNGLVFLNFVAYGDYWAQNGSDTTQKPAFGNAGKPMGHYGILVHIGNTADTAILNNLVGEFFSNNTQYNIDYAHVFGIHSMPTYAADLMAIGVTR